MAEKNTLSILESIKQKMIKFEQDPEKNEKIFDEIKDFEYVESNKINLGDQIKKEVLQQPEVDNSQIISDNIEDEEESKFDLDLEDYEGEEDDFLQDNSNFLFEDEAIDQKEQKNNQVSKQEPKLDSSSLQQQSDQIQKSQTTDAQKLDDDFDLDELEDEFLGAVSNSDKKEAQQQIDIDVEEDEDFLDLDDDIEEFVEENNSQNSSEISQQDNKAKNSQMADEVFNKITSEIDFANLDLSDKKNNEEKTLKNSPIVNEIDFEEDEEDFFDEKQELLKQQNQIIESNNLSLNESLEKSLIEKNKIEAMSDNSAVQNSYKMPLITKETLRQTTESIRKLMDASNVVSSIKTFSNQAPFNEIALQLMEPKLEKWINENLPELVEKIVREEIERIIPKKQ